MYGGLQGWMASWSVTCPGLCVVFRTWSGAAWETRAKSLESCGGPTWGATSKWCALHTRKCTLQSGRAETSQEAAAAAAFCRMRDSGRRGLTDVAKCCPNSLNFDEMLSCSLNFDEMLDRFCPCSTGRRTARCSRAEALCSTGKKRSFVKSSLKTKLKWYTRSRQERRPD